MKPVFGPREEITSARARGAFEELFPDRVEQRQAEIAALPVVEWKGRTLWTVTCCGDFGRGPHQVHIPESVIWNLMDLRMLRCPFHR